MGRKKVEGFEGEHPMVRVEWEDHTSLGGWQTMGEVGKETALGCVSIGYVVREDEKMMVLAGSFDTKYTDGRGHDVNHCHIILKSGVLKVERLRVGGNHVRVDG
jgi:hypothetical protein